MPGARSVLCDYEVMNRPEVRTATLRYRRARLVRATVFVFGLLVVGGTAFALWPEVFVTRWFHTEGVIRLYGLVVVPVGLVFTAASLYLLVGNHPIAEIRDGFVVTRSLGRRWGRVPLGPSRYRRTRRWLVIQYERRRLYVSLEFAEPDDLNDFLAAFASSRSV